MDILPAALAPPPAEAAKPLPTGATGFAALLGQAVASPIPVGAEGEAAPEFAFAGTAGPAAALPDTMPDAGPGTGSLTGILTGSLTGSLAVSPADHPMAAPSIEDGLAAAADSDLIAEHGAAADQVLPPSALPAVTPAMPAATAPAAPRSGDAPAAVPGGPAPVPDGLAAPRPGGPSPNPPAQATPGGASASSIASPAWTPPPVAEAGTPAPSQPPPGLAAAPASAPLESQPAVAARAGAIAPLAAEARATSAPAPVPMLDRPAPDGAAPAAPAPAAGAATPASPVTLASPAPGAAPAGVAPPPAGPTDDAARRMADPGLVAVQLVQQEATLPGPRPGTGPGAVTVAPAAEARAPVPQASLAGTAPLADAVPPADATPLMEAGSPALPDALLRDDTAAPGPGEPPIGPDQREAVVQDRRAAELRAPDIQPTDRQPADRQGTEPASAPALDSAPRTPPVAASLATRAASPAAFAWPARQVAPFAVALALGPDSSLTLTLDPAELGRVEVAIERAQGEASIRVTAERADTLMLLQRDARELERALADIGLGERGPTLSFSLGDGGASRDASGRQGDRGGGNAPRLGLAGPAGATGLPLAAAAARQGAAHRGLLDLAV